MKGIRPYNNDSFNIIYNLLFCDDINLYQQQNESTDQYPWNVLFSSTATTKDLTQLVADLYLESRTRILAYKRLAAAGTPFKEKELLGVIVEVAMKEGIDTLAAYKDGTARYLNQAEKLIVWDTVTPGSNKIIQQLFADSAVVVSKIGAWEKDRLPPPQQGDIRLSFLVNGDLYFGQGPFEVLQKDAMGGPVINSALALLQFLSSQEMK